MASGFIFQFENVCISCNRPCKLSFDKDNRLHAQGDAYSVYARHGEEIYEECGSFVIATVL
ncbi:MAG: hypothetical protein AAFW70_04715 [Cyanobacteria bacterium J06635_10]